MTPSRGLAACVALSVTFALPARAADEGRPVRFEATVLAGYGAGGGKYLDLNAYGFGFGGEFGVVLVAPPRLYFAAAALTFSGENYKGVTRHNTLLDLEVGYDFPLLGDHFYLRPKVLAGFALAPTTGGDNDHTDFGMHLAPALLAGGRFGHLHFGAELREDVLIGDGGEQEPATTVLGAVGVTL